MSATARSVLALLLVFYAFRLYLIATLALAPDESHYWYWSQHPQLGYYDHPPMVAYLIGLFTRLGGNGEFFVRIGAVLCSVLTLVLAFKSARVLRPEDRDLAWLVVLLLHVTLLFAAGAMIPTPDTPLILFWSLAIYAGARIARGGGPGWWYVLGLALGLGLLSKYTMILIVGCFGAFLLASPRHRFWWRRKEPYVALLLAAVIFLPVVVWNARHDWVSFLFQFGHGLSEGEAAPLSKTLEWLGGQAAVVTPLLFVAFLVYGGRGAWQAARERSPEYMFLTLTSWPILLFFGLAALRGGAAFENWPAPSYVAGFILMADVYRRRQGRKALMVSAVALAVVVNVLVHVHLAAPFLPIPPHEDATKQFHGWRQLGARISSVIDAHPSDEGYFLVADRGLVTVAGAVYYSGRRYTGIDFTRPKEFTFLSNVDELTGKDALLLLENRSDEQMQRFSRYFEDLIDLGEHDILWRGEPLQRFRLRWVIGKRFRGNWKASTTPQGVSGGSSHPR